MRRKEGLIEFATLGSGNHFIELQRRIGCTRVRPQCSSERLRNAFRFTKVRPKPRNIANASIQHGRVYVGARESTAVLGMAPARRFDRENHCAVRVAQARRHVITESAN